MNLETLKALGCGIMSAARVLLRACGFLNPPSIEVSKFLNLSLVNVGSRSLHTFKQNTGYHLVVNNSIFQTLINTPSNRL